MQFKGLGGNMMHRIEYIDNKLINVKSIPYDDSSVGSYAEPKTNNDYIMMKDKYLKEMSSIRASVESIEDMTLRDVLFYRYIEQGGAFSNGLCQGSRI